MISNYYYGVVNTSFALLVSHLENFERLKYLKVDLTTNHKLPIFGDLINAIGTLEMVDIKLIPPSDEEEGSITQAGTETFITAATATHGTGINRSHLKQVDIEAQIDNSSYEYVTSKFEGVEHVHLNSKKLVDEEIVSKNIRHRQEVDADTLVMFLSYLKNLHEGAVGKISILLLVLLLF